MMKWIDSFLNRITMYRLVLYELIFLLAVAAALSAIGILAFNPLSLAFSACFIFIICWAVNRAFAYFYDAPYNPESTWITALILALIIAPPTTFLEPQYLTLAFWASAWAVASKYIFALYRKHLFNPVAFGIAATDVFLGISALWWIGTLAMLPFVLIAGLLIVRKIHRFDLWWAFILTFTAGIFYSAFASGNTDFVRVLQQSFVTAPVFFFSTVMLTEPATMPPTRYLRVLFGMIIALFFLPTFHIGSFYFTPELALLAGNIVAFVVSPKRKLLLRLKEKIQLSADVYDFVFTPDAPLSFAPGQYLEWTLQHATADSRGVRRYFTIASAPEEQDIHMGVKFYEPASTYKQELLAMQPGDTIIAGQLAGDFTLPANKGEKLIFIAGGIGVTPFRSMIVHLMIRRERRPITMLYAVRSGTDAVYADLFEAARAAVGVNTVYVFPDAPPDTANTLKKLDRESLAKVVPDYRERTFYISGPQGMVTAFKGMLQDLGVHRTRIRTDYFPGFA